MTHPPLAARVSSVIQARLDDPAFDVRGLAKALGLSRSWLHRRLADAGGPPPGTRIREARLTRATELLGSTDRTIADVAAAVGFRDPAHFTRSFKRTFGTTPTAFRRDETPQNSALSEPGQQNGKSPRPPFNRNASDPSRLR